MKNVKRAVAVMVAFCLTLILFGCFKQHAHVPIKEFNINCTSSVLNQSYHFSVNVQQNNSMTVCGFCYDEESEFRISTPVYLSKDAVEELSSMNLEKLPTKKNKKTFFDNQLMDGESVKVTVTHIDDSEREVDLSVEMIDRIVNILRNEFITSVNNDLK